MSKATPSKKAKATPKKAKAAGGDEDEEASPSKKGGKAKPKVKTEEGDEGVVESVEGPKGVALGGDPVWES